MLPDKDLIVALRSDVSALQALLGMARGRIKRYEEYLEGLVDVYPELEDEIKDLTQP
jgi:hypothetical protein